MQQINKFHQKYNNYFFISKFLLTKQKDIFTMNCVKFSSDVNKASVIYIFWIFFLLFKQLPTLQCYSKNNLIEKIGHSALLVTKTASNLFTTFKKLTNYFLVFANTDLVIIEWKKKNKINNLILKENSYFNELIYLPKLFVDPFDMTCSVIYKTTQMSCFEKVQILRVFQIPIVIKWSITKTIKKNGK